MRTRASTTTRLAAALATLASLASPALAPAQQTQGAGEVIQTDLTPYHTITVGRATGVTGAAVGSDIGSAPSYIANFNAVREGTNLNGVVRLRMFTAANTLLGSCTGALFGNSPIVVTAAHCVSPTILGAPAARVDVQFLGAGGAFTTISSTQYAIAPGYDPTFVQNNNDVAYIRLPTAAPAFAVGYSLFSGDPLFQRTLLAGFGLCGNGLTGDIFSCGGNRLAGVNQFDLYGVRLFNSSGNEVIGITTSQTGILVSDFDDGTLAKNSLCVIPSTCNAGLDREVSTGRGDSGGAAFINGQIVGVASWGTGSTRAVDCPGGQAGGFCGARFGDVQGFASFLNASNRAFILASTVPEPSTVVLLGGGLLAIGVGAVRKRRQS